MTIITQDRLQYGERHWILGGRERIWDGCCRATQRIVSPRRTRCFNPELFKPPRSGSHRTWLILSPPPTVVIVLSAAGHKQNSLSPCHYAFHRRDTPVALLQSADGSNTQLVIPSTAQSVATASTLLKNLSAAGHNTEVVTQKTAGSPNPELLPSPNKPNHSSRSLEYFPQFRGFEAFKHFLGLLFIDRRRGQVGRGRWMGKGLWEWGMQVLAFVIFDLMLSDRKYNAGI